MLHWIKDSFIFISELFSLFHEESLLYYIVKFASYFDIWNLNLERKSLGLLWMILMKLFGMVRGHWVCFTETKMIGYFHLRKQSQLSL